MKAVNVRQGNLLSFFSPASTHCDTFLLFSKGCFLFYFKLHTHFLLTWISSKGLAMDPLLENHDRIRVPTWITTGFSIRATQPSVMHTKKP